MAAKVNCNIFILMFVLNQGPPEDLRRIALVLALKARDWAIRLPGSSHAEAALASRVDVHVSLNRWVVKSLIKGGEGVRGGGNGKGLFLTRNGGLEGKGNAEDGKEGEKREEGASHVDVGDVDDVVDDSNR